ncbi:hypothetical protein ACXC9Q_10330 [Kribbella sp. CWNU-51]
MSADERAARAEGRLRAAYGIVRELELLERWGKYGEVVIVGSVGIGVVVLQQPYGVRTRGPLRIHHRPIGVVGQVWVPS